jgi:hypothetical protein
MKLVHTVHVLTALVIGGVLFALGCGGSSAADTSAVDAAAGAASTDAGQVGAPHAPGDVDAAAPRLDFYVDPDIGDDDAAGTKAAPLKSLALALDRIAPGGAVHLAPGNYQETISGVVPDGVAIVADHGRAVLHAGAQGVTALLFLGGGKARNLVLQGFAVGVQASSGTQQLQGVTFQDNITGLQVKNGADLTLTGGTITGGEIAVVISDDARFTMVGGELAHVGLACGGIGALWAGGDATVTMRGVAIHDNLDPIEILGSARGWLDDCTITNNGAGACEPQPTFVVGDFASFALRTSVVSGSSAGVLGATTRGPVGINDDTIMSSGDVAVLDFEGAFGDVIGTSLAGDGTGTAIRVGGLSEVVVTGATLARFDTALRVEGGVVALRRTKLDACTSGIDLGNAALDLGTAADPGGNALAGVAETALRVSTSAETTITASGNEWIAGTQGADGDGHFLSCAVCGPWGLEAAPPRNLVLEKAGPTVAF